MIDKRKTLLALPLLFIGLTACRQDMQDQPRYKPLAASDFFSDHRSARPPSKEPSRAATCASMKRATPEKSRRRYRLSSPSPSPATISNAAEPGSTFIAPPATDAWATETAWWCCAATGKPRLTTATSS